MSESTLMHTQLYERVILLVIVAYLAPVLDC